MQIEEIKQKVVPVLNRHNVVEAYLFGSVARGDDRPDSDIDILAQLTNVRDLFQYMEVKFDLEDALGGRKVDLVQMKALRPEYKPYVEKDKISLL